MQTWFIVLFGFVLLGFYALTRRTEEAEEKLRSLNVRDAQRDDAIQNLRELIDERRDSPRGAG